MTRQAHVSLFSSALIGIALTACGGGGSGGDSNTDASGTIAFVAKSALTSGDAEPNDSVDRAQPVDLQLDRELRIRGTVGEGDAIDAFTLVARERSAVTVQVVPDGAPAHAIQLAVFDPLAMRVAQRAEAGALHFDARGAFDLVMRADGWSGAYTLVVRAHAAGDRALRAGWIGSLAVGDTFTLAGGTSTWTATAAEAGDVVVAGLDHGTVRVVNKATGSEVVCTANETRVPVGLLDALEITAQDASPVRVRVEAPALATAPRGFTRQAALADERAAWNVDATAPLYGATVIEAVAGEVLVRARSGNALDGEYARRSCTVKDVVPGIAELVATPLPPALDAAERARATVALARSFAASPNVEYAELNIIRRAQGGPVTPNDTHYGLQWHYPLIKLPEAWGIFTGATNAIVAVIDTGERPHPDLNANLIAGYDFISSPSNAGDGNGRDADPFDVGDGTGPTPSSFHGTHVAGTIAAVTNNASGVAGVCGPANHTRVMHLRVLGKDGGTDADIAQAVLYAARLTNASGTLPAQRADVINMSLGGPGSTSTMQNAVNAAFAAGVVIFGAAGNNNSGTAFYPAAYSHVVSVSAVDINAIKAPYSNHHSSVDVCAPGGNSAVDLNADTYPDGVLSTLVDEMSGSPIFAFYQGTSMACPHAAGVAALMRSQNPALTPGQIESILKSTAIDLGTAGADSIYGAGLIDAYRAVLAAAGGPGGNPTLSVVPTLLAFGETTTSLTFQVDNIGGGLLDVGVISSSDPWLTVVEVPSASGATDVGAVTCTVDRTALAAGDYTATVTVNANNGTVPSATVSVTMSVVPAPVVVDVDIFVLAVDVDTLETVQQIVVNPTTGLHYEFTDLPPGNYLIVAGSDEDTSDGICGPNDLYCGFYPTANDPEVVSFDGGNVHGLNFVVGPTEDGPAGATPHRTYAVHH